MQSPVEACLITLYPPQVWSYSVWEEFASLARVGDELSEFMKKIQTRGLPQGLALEYYLELREPGCEGFRPLP